MNFIFILTHQGCFFIQEKKGKILLKKFYETLESFQDRNFLHHNSHTPLHLFFDTQDQSYKWEKFPTLHPWTRRKILEHRCGDQNSEYHWFKKDKQTYLFVDLKFSNDQRAWLQFLPTFPNPIPPPRLIPLEIAARVQEKVCTVLMYQEEPIGLRQVVVNEGRFLLTRLIPFPFLVTPVQAGAQGTKQDLATGKGHERGDDKGGNTETTQLLTYLKTTYGIEDVKIVPLNAYFEEVIKIVYQAPIIPLRLKLWAAYYREERLRKALLALSFLCIMALIVGSFYLDDQFHQRETILREREHAVAVIDTKLNALPSAVMGEETEKAALWERYEALRKSILNPLNTLEKLSSWLTDDWQVTNIHWHKDTEETLEVGLQYLGPRYASKIALNIQVEKPLTPYIITIFKDDQEHNALRFKRPIETA